MTPGSDGARARHVLVTGATGFLGSRLVPLLCDRGHHVHVLARGGAARPGRGHLGGDELAWHEADLLRPDSIAPAVVAAAARADAAGAALDVIHAGARISYRRRDRAEAEAVNVGGTRALLAACGDLGDQLGRLVHVGSVVAVGWSDDPAVVLDEEAPFPANVPRCHYVRTKRQADLDVLAAAARLDAVIVAPGAIFGAAPVRSNTKRLLEELRRRGGVPLAPPGSLSVVGLRDVADGCLAALERGRRGARYLLTESHWTHRALQAEVARRLGTRPPRGVVPRPLWALLRTGVAGVDRLRACRELTPMALWHLGQHYHLSAARARTELDWRPRPFVEVLSEALAGLDPPPGRGPRSGAGAAAQPPTPALRTDQTGHAVRPPSTPAGP